MRAAAGDRQDGSHINSAIAYAMTIVHPVESGLVLQVVHKIERIMPDRLEHPTARMAIITKSDAMRRALEICKHLRSVRLHLFSFDDILHAHCSALHRRPHLHYHSFTVDSHCIRSWTMCMRLATLAMVPSPMQQP